MKVFMAGGTGFVGGNLCATLREAGHELRLLVHSRHECHGSGIEQVEGDATDMQTFAGKVAGCDAVINLIGIIREFPGRGISFEKLHVEATRTMLAATKQAGIRRYIQMSSLGTRPDAVSGYHQTKWRAEELVRESGLEWTIFRPSLIFGPGDAFVNMLAGQIRKLPVVPVIGDGAYRMQPISVNDVARCFSMALGMPETVGQTFELCGGDRMSFGEMLDVIGKVLGKKSVPKLHNPLGIMKLATALLERFQFYPVTMDQIQMLLEENICDGRWREAFRFEPEPFEPGISRYLR